MTLRCRWVVVLCLSAVTAAAVAQEAEPAGVPDAYIAGYAAAILERDLALDPAILSVSGGVVSVDATGLGRGERVELRRNLERIAGVREVRFEGDAPAVTAEAAGVEGVSGRPMPAAEDGTPTLAGDQFPEAVLSPGRLFEPIVADPRWPHFYASYNYYFEGGAGEADDLEHVASVGFGETIAFLRQDLGGGRRYEVGVQAGVFAIFDLDTDSEDLVNADYFVGPFAAYRGGDFSAFLRAYHQSSHLGDEFILNNTVDRVNLSYEVVDALVSYDLPGGVRLYGGGGAIVSSQPDLDPWILQYGGQWSPPVSFFDGLARPIFAADLQHRDETGYDLDASLRAGFEVSDPQRQGNRLLILLEYYNGHSPNGQFFEEDIEFLGVGAHFYF